MPESQSIQGGLEELQGGQCVCIRVSRDEDSGDEVKEVMERQIIGHYGVWLSLCVSCRALSRGMLCFLVAMLEM